MSIVAIIPARGGSKRIPRKNIKLFCGKPIIAYSIQAARDAKLFDRIIVSTDDGEIKAVAEDYGAEVPFLRPTELANDLADTDTVLLHALRWLATNNDRPVFACCIYATAPFVRTEDIRLGLNRLRAEGATSAMTVTSFPYSIFRALKLNSAQRLEMIWPENITTRSQDFEEAVHDAGQFYWIDVPRYLKEERLLSQNSIALRLPRYLVQDIDTLEDWEQAERMFQTRSATSRSD